VSATGILYFNFAWFREQLCIIICPYGRLQSALGDRDTVFIGYDAVRGEPRGKVGTAKGALASIATVASPSARLASTSAIARHFRQRSFANQVRRIRSTVIPCLPTTITIAPITTLRRIPDIRELRLQILVLMAQEIGERACSEVLHEGSFSSQQQQDPEQIAGRGCRLLLLPGGNYRRFNVPER
jgi:hypothetical protein